MDDDAVMQRVVGILTQASEYARAIEADPDADVDDTEALASALLTEIMPTVTLHGDLSAQDVADAVSRELGSVISQLVGTFCAAFLALSRVHDAGRSDVSSADVLRDLALRAAQGEAD